MNKILCVGQSTYDITYVMKGFPVENRKYRAHDRIMISGGPSNNAAYLLSMYGEAVSYITRLGKDVYGKEILKDLEEIGIDTKNIIVDENFVTPCSFVVTNSENGSRTIINYRETTAPKNIKINYKNDPEIILLDGHELTLSLKVLEMFPNAIKVIDAGTYKEGTLKLGPLVDYFICSEDFAREYTKVSKIDESNFLEVLGILKTFNKNTVIITLGERGSIMEKDGKLIRFKAFKANAIDTTGAGDIFHGAFVYGLSNGFSIEKNIEFSAACASLSVEKLGGRSSIPEFQEILERIKRG